MKKYFCLLLVGTFLCGCAQEKVDPSGKYLHNSYFKHEKMVVPIYATGSVQQVEQALNQLLVTIDDYQWQAPGVWAYNWIRGLTQARLALLYEREGDQAKASDFMTRAVVSIRIYRRHKFNGEKSANEVTEDWVRNVVSKLDAPLNAQWKRSTQQSAAPLPPAPQPGPSEGAR